MLKVAYFCLFLENSLKMPKKQTYFSERDLLIGLLKHSIPPVLGAKYARRTLLSNNGTSALYSHAKGGTRNANLKECRGI